MQLILTESKKIAQKFTAAGYKVFSPFYENNDGYYNPCLRAVGFKKTNEGFNLHFELNITAITNKKWNDDSNIWGHCFRHVSEDNAFFERIKQWVNTSVFSKGRVDLKNGGRFGHVVADFVFLEIDDKPKTNPKNGYQFYQVKKLSFPKGAKYTWKGSGYAPELEEPVEGIEDLLEQA